MNKVSFNPKDYDKNNEFDYKKQSFKVPKDEIKISSRSCKLCWKCSKCNKVNKKSLPICEGEFLSIKFPCKNSNIENLTITFKCSNCKASFKLWLELEKENKNQGSEASLKTINKKEV